MEKVGPRFVLRHVIIYEIISFVFVLIIIWLDEVVDLPGMFLGADPSPFNWREALLETIIVILFGSGIIYITQQLFKRMKYLEGTIPVCASCKKIRKSDDSWQSIEEYIRDQSNAEFSHAICPECFEKLYPQFSKKE